MKVTELIKILQEYQEHRPGMEVMLEDHDEAYIPLARVNYESDLDGKDPEAFVLVLES